MQESEWVGREVTWWDFYFQSCGYFYGYALPISGAISLGITSFLTLKGRGPTLGPALVLTSIFTVLLGVLCTVEHLYVTLQFEPPEKQWDWIVAIGAASTTLRYAIYFAIPGWFTAIIGSSVRALKSPSQELRGT